MALPRSPGTLFDGRGGGRGLGFKSFEDAIARFALRGGVNTTDDLPPGLAMARDLFARALDPSWEVYIRSYLNGIRPDLVLLNPNVGVGVFEVLEWTEADMRARASVLRDEEDGPRDPRTLWALLARREDGSNPMLLARQARDDIFDIYCPRLPDARRHCTS